MISVDWVNAGVCNELNKQTRDTSTLNIRVCDNTARIFRLITYIAHTEMSQSSSYTYQFKEFLFFCHMQSLTTYNDIVNERVSLSAICFRINYPNGYYFLCVRRHINFHFPLKSVLLLTLSLRMFTYLTSVVRAVCLFIPSPPLSRYIIYISNFTSVCITKVYTSNYLVSQYIKHPYVISHESTSSCKEHLWYSSSIIINPLRAKFFWGNINIYLHFMSFLHIDWTQVLKILPQVSKGPTYSTQSISCLMISWWRKEPGHQQPR